MSFTNSFEKDMNLLQSQTHAVSTWVAVQSRSDDAESKELIFFVTLKYHALNLAIQS